MKFAEFSLCCWRWFFHHRVAGFPFLKLIWVHCKSLIALFPVALLEINVILNESSFHALLPSGFVHPLQLRPGNVSLLEKISNYHRAEQEIACKWSQEPCFCRRSSIQFALHNAVVKIFLVLSALGPPLLLCFLLLFSSLPFFCPLLLLFSVSLNLTLRKRATSPWILHVSKNSRTADWMQNSYNDYRRLLNYMIPTKLYNSVSFLN